MLIPPPPIGIPPIPGAPKPPAPGAAPKATGGAPVAPPKGAAPNPPPAAGAGPALPPTNRLGVFRGGGAPEPPKPDPSPLAPKVVLGAFPPKPPNALEAGPLFEVSPPPPNGFAAAAPKLGVEPPPKPGVGAGVPNGVEAGLEDATVEALTPKVNAPAADAGAACELDAPKPPNPEESGAAAAAPKPALDKTGAAFEASPPNVGRGVLLPNAGVEDALAPNAGAEEEVPVPKAGVDAVPAPNAGVDAGAEAPVPKAGVDAAPAPNAGVDAGAEAPVPKVGADDEAPAPKAGTEDAPPKVKAGVDDGAVDEGAPKVNAAPPDGDGASFGSEPVSKVEPGSGAGFPNVKGAAEEAGASEAASDPESTVFGTVTPEPDFLGAESVAVPKVNAAPVDVGASGFDELVSFTEAIWVGNEVPNETSGFAISLVTAGSIVAASEAGVVDFTPKVKGAAVAFRVDGVVDGAPNVKGAEMAAGFAAASVVEVRPDVAKEKGDGEAEPVRGDGAGALAFFSSSSMASCTFF